MSIRSTLIKGTFILTFAGFLTRIMGFFFKILLSRIFSAEEIGLYQLIFPVYTLVFSITASGMQTALSRCTANYYARNQKDKALQTLKIALSFSLLLSLTCVLIIQKNALYISQTFLGDSRCASLLVPLTCAFPFAAMHSCICGYFLGQKVCEPVAFSQFLEQAFRILSVLTFLYFSMQNNTAASIHVAVYGLVIGEISASFYLIVRHQKTLFHNSGQKRDYSSALPLLRLALPLSANRISLNIIQGMEAVSIPLKLQSYGLAASEALSLYGIFSGMALPCIFFPSAITNALSSLLLPTIAEFQISRSAKELKEYIQKISALCFLMGLFCTACFLFTADFIGEQIFHKVMVSDFLKALAFICPFLYCNTTLISILNGLGNTSASFVINLLSLAVRLLSVHCLIPLYGFKGYFLGLLASQLLISILSCLKLRKTLS